MHAKITPENFWSFVAISDPESCWEWQGPVEQGRGRFMYQRKRYLAPRWAWELHHDAKIPDDMCACHHCDNPLCCNPHHIFVGTWADNNRDRANKGRSTRGSEHPKSRLSEGDVLSIRRRYAAGESWWRIWKSDYAHVKQSSVDAIVHRRNWKHL